MPNPRLPDELKALKGTLRKDRQLKGAVQVDPVKIPPAPKYLLDAEKEVWARFRKILQPLNIVAETDLPGFEAMVRSFARAQALFAVPESELKDVLAASKEVRSWLTVFGLTPQSRSTIKRLGGEESAKTLDDFLEMGSVN